MAFFWKSRDARVILIDGNTVKPLGGLYQSALDFQNLEWAARRVVIEHADHQPPSIPSEGIKVGSVLLQDRAVRVLFMAVYDMAVPISAFIAIVVDLPDDIL